MIEYILRLPNVPGCCEISERAAEGLHHRRAKNTVPNQVRFITASPALYPAPLGVRLSEN